MTSAMAPYRSEQPVGRDGFAQLLRAEFTKFRTVRAWVITLGVAAALMVGFGVGDLAAHRRLRRRAQIPAELQHAKRPSPSGRPRWGARRRHLLLRAPAADRQRQCHCQGHLAHRDDRLGQRHRELGPDGRPAHASRSGAVGQSRADHRQEHQPGIRLRGGHGHPRATACACSTNYTDDVAGSPRDASARHHPGGCALPASET